MKKVKHKILPYSKLYTAKAKGYLGKRGIMVPPRSSFTCSRCGANRVCEFAWDLYNTGGDCLAMK